MKKYVVAFLVIVALFLAGVDASATAQFPDRLTWKDKEYSLYSNPLESYFGAQNPRPRNLFPVTCTACWRGYVASWKIEDGFLQLTKIIRGTCQSDAPQIPIDRIFPGRKLPINATWFSGTLRIPDGKILRYVHMGYGSVFEREIVLSIEAGKLVREETIDNTRTRVPSEEEKGLDELRKLKEWEDKNQKDRQG